MHAFQKSIINGFPSSCTSRIYYPDLSGDEIKKKKE
jgi:hypothetical protein